MLQKLTTPKEDVLDLRFSFNPMNELILSYHLLNTPRSSIRYYQWMEEARRAISELELPSMHAILSAGGYIPDFLTPTPIEVVQDIETQFDAILDTPQVLIRANILTLGKSCKHKGFPEHGREVREEFLKAPHESLVTLVEEMRTYWQHTLAHHWQRIHGVLENDVMYHARQMAFKGTANLLRELDDALDYNNGYLKINYVHKPHKLANSRTVYPRYSEQGFPIQNDTLQLVPVLFGGEHLYYQFAEEWRPMIMYTPRGTGLWYSPPAPDDSLTLLLGASRSRLLTALLQPASTGELAIRLSLTAGAVSQQLGRLSQAGLVESQRIGKTVHYRLSHKGEQLLALF